MPPPTAKTKGSTITSAHPDASNSYSAPLNTTKTKGSTITSASPDASNSNTMPLTTARTKGSNSTSTYLDASNPNSRTRRSVGSVRGSAAASPLLNLSAIRKAHRPRVNERSPSSVLPKRRDSSIGATSTNPKLRRGSVFETATPVKANAPVDFSTSEGQAAMKKLRMLFAPVLMHAILRRRLRRKATKNPTRKYTPEAIVSAIRASKSLLADWPMTILHSLALEATYLFPQKQETIVYYNEPHLSCGMVVLLHGQLLEKRTKAVDGNQRSVTKVADRPIRSQRVRTRYAPDVLCVLPVLCEDRSLTSLSTGPTPADIAIIPSRAFWSVYNRFVVESPEAGTVTDSFRDRVISQRTEMLLSSYYPTSVALQRSWCWEFFSSSDRVKLARMMEVRVLGIGDVLVEEGVFSPYLYVVRRGMLTAVVKGEPLALVEPGMAFGEESILFNDPRNCTIIAGTVCELYALHVRALHHRFNKYPELAQRVIAKALERRSRWMDAGRTRNIFGLVSVLSSVPCLSHTTDAMREAIAECAQVLTTPAGFRLVTRNTPCQSLYVIGRGALRVGGQVDAGRSYFCVPGVGEAVSAGDFFGELCLRPHLWPTDVVSESSVDLWVISRTELLEVLEGFLADAQALEVCRQGIALYQAQNGKTSITEGFEAPSAQQRDSRAPRPATPNRRPLSGMDTRDSLGVTSGRKSRDLSATLLKSFEWTEYAKVRREELSDDLESHVAPRELREADKEIEKAIMPRVRDLISVTVDAIPGPADSDLPGEVTELQAIIVEQLLLTPSAQQPRFLHQINHSNVKLVTEEANSNRSTPVPHEEVVASTEDLSGKDTIYSLGVPPELEQILSDDVETPAATEEPDNLSFESTAGGSLFGRSRRSIDESFSGLFMGSQQLGRISFANLRSHNLVRPQSGMPTTPRAAANAGSVNNLHDHIFSSRSSIMPPLSSEQKSVSFSAQRIRPASVDYAQQAKKNTERSDSMLNHYIKIENQNYFSDFVKVQPLEPEEVWLGGEDTNRAGSILVLMHVKGCNYLLPEVMEGCQQPFVKIFTGSRELARTPVMNNRVDPVWTIEESSSVGFIRRGEDISCVICDATNENRVVYQCVMSTTSIRAGGGVGEMHLVLHRTTSQPGNEEVPDHRARVSITLMVVTASNYKALHDHLLAESDGEDEDSNDTSEHEENRAYIQVLGVEGLQHRIEASVTVTIEEDGTTRNVLEAPPVLPKTRSPSWPAKVSFARLRGDGYVTLSVLHKGVRIGACETTVGDFVYGGTGVRRLPLRSDGNEPTGELLVYVLGTSTATATEATHTESALFFSVVRFTAEAEVLQMVPDPFVVVRNPDGEETLRTPLALSTYSAAWDPAMASCLLPCPVLPGRGDVYTLTVFDNSDKSAPLGEATFTVAHDGLGPHTRYDIPLVNGKGTVRVEAHCLPIQRLSSSSVFDKVPNAAHFSAMDPLVLVHVAGCTQLPGWEDEAAMEADGGKPFLLTDSIATLAIGKQQYLRTPEQSSCNPHWPVSVASALLRVRPEETHETALFEVYDGCEDEEDKIGEVRARLVDLCCTGKHCLALHAPRKTKGHHDSSRDSDAKDGIGSLVLSTYVVQLGAQVAPPGKLYIFPEDHRSVTTAAASELADLNAEDNRASSRYVQIALTNLCNLSQLLVDTGSLVQVTVSLAAQQKVLLRTTRVILPQEVLAFDAAEGTSTVDLQNLSGEALRAEVTIVSQQVLGSASDDTKPTMPATPLLMLEGNVPWETLSTTGSEDVHVFTVSLTNTADSKEVRAGRPPSTPMAVARKATTHSRTATDLGTAKLATLSMGVIRLKSTAAVN